MRILVLADNFPPETNAVAARIYERARFWATWGHRVTVVTSFPNFPAGKRFVGYEKGWYKRERIDGIEVVRLPTIMRPNSGTVQRALDQGSYLPLAATMATLLRGVDVVFASSPHFFAGLAGPFATRLGRRPLVLEIADMWPESIVAVGAMERNAVIRGLERLEMWLYRRSDRIVALTPAFKENMVERGIDGHKIHVIPNGADLRLFHPTERDPRTRADLGIADDAFVLAYLGTMGPAHGLETAIAAARLLEDEPRFRLLFVGAGAREEALKAEAAGSRNVIFQPRQPREAIPALWAASDAALVHLTDSPTFASVYPSKIFEAMAMGQPIIFGGPQGIGSALIEQEQVGLCATPSDPTSLAGLIRTLMADPEAHARMASNGLNAVPRYSREAQARAVLKVLEDSAR